MFVIIHFFFSPPPPGNPKTMHGNKYHTRARARATAARTTRPDKRQLVFCRVLCRFCSCSRPKSAGKYTIRTRSLRTQFFIITVCVKYVLRIIWVLNAVLCKRIVYLYERRPPRWLVALLHCHVVIITIIIVVVHYFPFRLAPADDNRTTHISL